MTKSIVLASGLRKQFGDITALDGAEIEIPSGITGLIGPNGAGKTTLLRVLLGLIRADKGNAAVLGLDVREHSMEIRRRIGVLHEKPSYPRFLTPTEYLETMSRLYPRHRESVELLELVNLSDARNRKIGNLSAGMQQRLGIAQSLMGYPEAVLMDEPTANLDVIGRDQVIQLVGSLYRDTSTSFLISSHILSELEKVCHAFVFLNRGRVVESGNLVDIIKRHTSDRYRVLTSDSDRLLQVLQNHPGFDDVKISSPNVISLVAKAEADSVRSMIEAIAREHQIEVFDVSRSTSVEDVFREVLRSEAQQDRH